MSPGMNRSAVLNMGEPASRITMYDDGHLVEIYSYRNIGHVRLSDGSVASIENR